MKKLAIIAVAVILVLLTACTGKQENQTPQNGPEEEQIRELFEQYQNADGAVSEGLMAQMLEQFAQDPAAFLTALSGTEQELQDLIADHLGASLYWEPDQYKTALQDIDRQNFGEAQLAVLDKIFFSYDAAYHLFHVDG